MIYRICCDDCGLDTYITNEFKPNKCPRCDMSEHFMAATEQEVNDADLAFYQHAEDKDR